MKKILIEYHDPNPIERIFERDLRDQINSLQSSPLPSSVDFSYQKIKANNIKSAELLSSFSPDVELSNGIISGEFSDSLIPHLKKVKNVISVWDDIQIFPTPCSNLTSDFDVSSPIGSYSEVQDKLNCSEFWGKGYKGEGVVIAICDTGVDKSKFNVIDGWSPDGTSAWGSAGQGSYGFHGSMVAHAALLVAPDVEIIDLGILKYRGSRGAWLSEALLGFNWLLNWCQNNPSKRVIINNSWSTYRRIENDNNVNSYAKSPNHPFTKRCNYIAKLGIPMVFAAGNCGCPQPDLRCGSGDIGDGNSIWGVNSLESVFTVGAVSIDNTKLPYSSTGPGFFYTKKPDVCSYSHFKGYLEVDPGTSTSAPIVAGMMAVLISVNNNVPTKDVLDALRKTAIGNDNYWSPELGYGIASLEAAYKYLFE